MSSVSESATLGMKTPVGGLDPTLTTRERALCTKIRTVYKLCLAKDFVPTPDSERPGTTLMINGVPTRVVYDVARFTYVCDDEDPDCGYRISIYKPFSLEKSSRQPLCDLLSCNDGDLYDTTNFDEADVLVCKCRYLRKTLEHNAKNPTCRIDLVFDKEGVVCGSSTRHPILWDDSDDDSQTEETNP